MAQSITVGDLLGSTDMTTEVIKAGHVGIMAGSKSKGELWPKLAAWLAERSGAEAAPPRAAKPAVRKATKKKAAKRTTNKKPAKK